MVTEAQVREALRSVLDPEIGRPIEDIGMLRGIAIDGDTVRVDVLIEAVDQRSGERGTRRGRQLHRLSEQALGLAGHGGKRSG